MKRVITVLAVLLLMIVPLMVNAESPDAGGDYTTAIEVQTGTSYNGSLDKFDPNNTDLMDYWKFPVTWGSMINIDFSFKFDAPGNNWFYVQLYSPDPADNGTKTLLRTFNANKDQGKGSLEWLTGIDEAEDTRQDYKSGIFNLIFQADMAGLYVNYTFIVNVTGQPELSTDSPKGYAIEITDSQDIDGHLGYWDSKDTYQIIVPARTKVDLSLKNTGSSSKGELYITIFLNGTVLGKADDVKKAGTGITYPDEGPKTISVEIRTLDGTDHYVPAYYNLKIEMTGEGPPPEPPDTNDTIDEDNDGLDDTWEEQYFGNLSQDGTQDPDSDGYTNYQEYENKTNPTNANDHPVEPDDDDEDEIPLLYVLIPLAAILLIIIVAVIVLLLWTKAQERKLQEEEEKEGRKKRKKKTKSGQKGKGRKGKKGKRKKFDDDDEWDDAAAGRRRKKKSEEDEWGDDDDEEEEEEEEEDWDFKPRKDKKRGRKTRGGRKGGRRGGRKRRGPPPPPQEGVNVRPKKGGRTPKRCGGCGARTEKGDVFCAECGYRF